ncbi:hypothetical protein G9A89_009227 [Geosiphon pyriformis]|nr:hypothetical protein G9A89_009227 [Geosiphon pyriformis]
MEFSDHAFMCSRDVVICNEILVEASAHWMLSASSLDVGLYSIVYKGFVLNKWCEETWGVFNDKKQAIGKIVNFVRFVANLHHVRAWLVRSEHRVQIEKAGLVADSGVVSGLSCDVSFMLSGGVVRMLGVVELFAVNFGHHLLCCFFSGLSGIVSVIIDATVGPVIAVIKKTIKVSGSEGGFKAVVLRKKRKEGVLTDGIDNRGTSDTTKSESIDIKKECLVEETSIDYGFACKDQKSVREVSKLSVCKSFALDIDLVAIAGKSSQEKLCFIRKIFSSVNSFGGASTPSKFGRIIHATFTLEKAMMAAGKLANDCGVVVNTNFKCLVNNCTNQAIVLKEIPVRTSIEAVCMAVSVFEQIKMIKMQLTDLLAAKWSILIGKDMVRDKFRVLLYTLPIETMAHDLWNFIGSVVIKDIGLYWLHLVTPLCSVCNSLDHLSLVCKLAGASFIPNSKRAPLSVQNKFRLAKIYEKKSVPISRPLAFGEKTWADVVGKPPFYTSFGSPFLLGSIDSNKPILFVSSVLEICLVSIESSLINLTGQISELIKRLDLLVLVVFQPSPELIRVGLGEANNDETAMIVDLLVSPHVVKLEKMLEGLFKSVLSLSCVLTNPFSMNELIWKIAMCNVCEMNNPAKQDDVIHWHKDMNNLISIVTKSKLKRKIQLWMTNRFVGVQVFTSGLDSGYLGAGVVIIMNSSLARHVCKVSEVPGQFLSIKLLFKNKLLVSILGLYTGVSTAVQFFQAVINSLIAKTVNESSFIVLGGNFNENGFRRYASFKKCLDLGLVNSLVGSQILKMSTWANSRGVRKTIDFMFVSLNLVNALVHYDVLDISEYFYTDHQAVSVSLGLGGLLNTRLNSLCKQTNRNRWKFDFKGANENK